MSFGRFVSECDGYHGCDTTKRPKFDTGLKLRSDVSRAPALRGTLMPREQFSFFDSHPPVVSEGHMEAAINQG